MVAHLQLGLLLQELGVPFADKGKRERAGVYLTNSLTGWEPPVKPKQLPFLELEEERDAADEVKREKPILVILGNPPYNSFAGIARVEEERGLSDAYRTTKKAPAPQGQGLNDLYVRFFRMAEKRIVEKTGAGVVCFISNYSWLDGLSFTGMREHYLEVFDRIWVDNLHGDRIISEYTPDGRTSETVFAIEGKSPGIKIGTAVSLMVRKTEHGDGKVFYRDRAEARASERRAALLESQDDCETYSILDPEIRLGLPFRPRAVGAGYLSWPLLPELFPVSFRVKTSRDDVVVDIDRDRLVTRMEQYFDPSVSHEAMRQIAPGAMASTARFQAEQTRDYLRKRGFKPECVVRFCYRPFDVRWLYWEPETKLLDEKRSEYFPHVFDGNTWFTASQRNRRKFDPPIVSSALNSLHMIEWSANCFPLELKSTGGLLDQRETHPNLSDEAQGFVCRLKVESANLFDHLLAILHAPAYGEENSGALNTDWPRIPLPSRKDDLEHSAALGREVASLLDGEVGVKGVTLSPMRAELRVIGVLSAAVGQLNPDEGDLDVTAGWGHAGKNGVTMPAKGKVVEREYTPEERGAFAEGATALGMSGEELTALLGATTFDVYLNGERIFGRTFRRAFGSTRWEGTR